MKFMVAFSSPKRSARTVETAANHARALGAELVLARVVPDAEKVGVVAQLIASDRPSERAQSQVDMVVEQLKASGVNASGVVRVGEVAPGIVKVATELQIDLIFVGTMNVGKRPTFFMAKDPIVHYLVDNCPIALFLVRNEETVDATGSDADEDK